MMNALPVRDGRACIAVLAVTLMTGCAVDPEVSTLGGGGDRVNSAGAHQLLDTAFEQVDLVRLLAPDGLRESDDQYCQKVGGSNNDAVTACRIDAAFDFFRTSEKGSAERRNAIQDRLIAASDRRCNVYLIYIQRHHAEATFTLGSLTSLLGGAGAIATGVTASRALAGSAGIFSGVRAEYEQSYYLNQTTNIIAAGIRARRKAILDDIDSVRADGQKNSLVMYTPERAVADAMRYHGACSLLAGLEQTAILVNAQAGLDAVLKGTKTANDVRDALKAVQPAAASAAGP